MLRQGMARTRAVVVGLMMTSPAITVLAEEFDMSGWKDPRGRDEDISHTSVSVDVQKTEQGLYEYVYTIASPAENKGTLSGILLDISCDIDFGDITMPLGDQHVLARNRSRDGKHVPVSTYGSENSGTIGVNVGNEAGWGMRLKPGEETTVRMLSPTPPRERSYVLSPYMESIGWRYDLYPDAPWTPDFVVQGMIPGPGCVSLDEAEVAFLGRADEPFNVNRLLGYAEPTTDVLTVNSDSAAVTFIIFYDKNIDPGTFKARLDGKDISSLFHPAPDTFEEVAIAGKWKRHSKLHLSVLGTVEDKSRGNETFKSIDNDFFDVEMHTQGGPK